MSWVEDELKVQDELRATALANAGRIPFYKAPIGESVVELDRTKEPEDRTNQRGMAQKGFTILAEGKEFLWTVSVKSPLYRNVLNILKNANSDKVKLKIIRTGAGVQTRYDVTEA